MHKLYLMMTGSSDIAWRNYYRLRRPQVVTLSRVSIFLSAVVIQPLKVELSQKSATRLIFLNFEKSQVAVSTAGQTELWFLELDLQASQP